jgi:phage protein D
VTGSQEHANRFKVLVGGSPLADPVAEKMVSIFVDDSLNLPDMMQVTFRDPTRKVLTDAGIQIGTELKVKVFNPDFPSGEELITAEVTALEAEYDTEGTMTVIRALDKSHRLSRGRLTASYENASYSDVAKKVAQRAGLKLGKVDSSQPVHEHVVQANVSDWQFIKGLAAEIGYEAGYVNNEFVFRKATESSAGPGKATLQAPPTPLQLVLGENLLRLRTIVTAAEQVKEVEVRGWDMKQQKAMVGKAPAKTNSATIDSIAQPQALAEKFGGKKYVSVHTPFSADAEVNAAAKALADQIGGSAAEMEGTARGNPKLRAGSVVSLSLVDKPFDGKYVVTSTRHTWTPADGYSVTFKVSGRQERSVFGLAGAGGANGLGPNDLIHGVVIAIVTDNKDPDKLGRVKVKFPWLADDYNSHWARMVAAGAGDKRGMVIYPEVNDEVLVAFEHGDPRRPYVLGGLYSSKWKPMEGTDLVSGTGKVERRGFISRKGHKLVFLDGDAKSGLMMGSSDNKLRISLNATKKQIRIISDGKIEIEAKDDIKIDGKKNISINAAMNLKLEGKAKLSASGGAGVSIDGGPMTDIKGGKIKLN